jgi:hypothetical protein
MKAQVKFKQFSEKKRNVLVNISKLISDDQKSLRLFLWLISSGKWVHQRFSSLSMMKMPLPFTFSGQDSQIKGLFSTYAIILVMS